MADVIHLDHITAEVLSSVRPVSLGRAAKVSTRPDVLRVRAEESDDLEVDELLLEDITLEIHSAQTPFVVGLGATAYLHPGVRAGSVVDGGAAVLADGAGVDDIDELALAQGRITIAPWVEHGEPR